MKKFLTAALIVALFVSSFGEALASGKTKNQYRASLIPNKGYWIIQESQKNFRQVTVFYYDNSNSLIRKETRAKRNADIRKRKVLRSLKRSLEEAVEWAQPI